MNTAPQTEGKEDRMWLMAEKIIARMTQALGYVACLALTALMALTTLNVLLREFWGRPIQGTYDGTGFLTTVLIGCGLAYCSLQDGHIEISFFVSKLNIRAQRILTLCGQGLSFAALSGFAYALLMLGLRLQQGGEVSVTTKTPLFGFAFLLSFSFIVFALTVLLKAVVTLRKGGWHES